MANVNRLPTEILLDIITRLPTECILDCKLVCNLGRHLVSKNESFSRIHRTRLNHSVNSGKMTFLVYDYNHQPYYFEYNDNDDNIPSHSIRRFNFSPPFLVYTVLGSFNGLICLYGRKNYAYSICNPVTKEYVNLPKLDRDCEYLHWSCGFGYLPLTNEYKIVELYKSKRESGFIEVLVCTLGSGHGWRNVGRLDTKFADISMGYGVFVSGSLHWMDSEEGKIFVFDLTEEKFSGYYSPPPSPQDCLYYSIGAFGEFLYYGIFSDEGSQHVDIWLLKEKNDNLVMQEQVEHAPLGWRKEFSLVGEEAAAFTSTGGVLGFDAKSRDIFNAISAALLKLVGCRISPQIIPHENTLVSLKEFGEEDVQIMEAAEIEETESDD